MNCCQNWHIKKLFILSLVHYFVHALKILHGIIIGTKIIFIGIRRNFNWHKKSGLWDALKIVAIFRMIKHSNLKICISYNRHETKITIHIVNCYNIYQRAIEKSFKSKRKVFLWFTEKNQSKLDEMEKGIIKNVKKCLES